MTSIDKMMQNRCRILNKNMRSIIKRNDCQIVIINDNIEHYNIAFTLEGGYYKGQTHVLEILTKYGANVPYLFPIHKPNIKFLTKIYHPNISNGGLVCVDFLTNHNKWSALYNFDRIISAIFLLLDTPNPSSPYNSNAAKLYTTCFKKYLTEKPQHLPEEWSSLEENCFKDYVYEANKDYSSNLSNHFKNFPCLKTHNKIVKSEEEIAELISLEEKESNDRKNSDKEILTQKKEYEKKMLKKKLKQEKANRKEQKRLKKEKKIKHAEEHTKLNEESQIV